MKRPRTSPLDRIPSVAAATNVLRDSGGNLSTARVARVFGVNPILMARWLGRHAQVNLEYFERVARLLAVVPESDFRRWLRTPNSELDMDTPRDWLERRRWQEVADLVEDMLTGAPT